MLKDYKKEILTTSLEGRNKEVTEYQVNIDNFRLAIEKIGDDPDLTLFKTQLEDLLKSSIYEQKKAKIMLEVIQSQLEN
jgi:hypothetical protein